MAEIWTDLIGVPARRRSNFFALGGDSLTATRVIQRLIRRFGVEITLHQLFTYATLADLAAVIDTEITLRSPDLSLPLEEGYL